MNIRNKLKSNTIPKSIIILLCILAVLVIVAMIHRNTKEKPTTAIKNLYENATEVEIKGENGEKAIAKYSISRVSSNECTYEMLNDWYFNYIVQNNYDACIILYSDKKDNSGVYATKEQIQKDVIFEIDKNENYSILDNSNCIVYEPMGVTKALVSTKHENEIHIISVSSNVDESDGSVAFSIETVLPEGEELTVHIKNKSGSVEVMTTIVLADGYAYTEHTLDNGKRFSGKYTVSIINEEYGIDDTYDFTFEY